MTNKEAIEYAGKYSFLELYEKGVCEGHKGLIDSVLTSLKELRACASDPNFYFDMGNYELVKEAFKWAEEVKDESN